MTENVTKLIGEYKVTIYPRFRRGMYGDICKGIHKETHKHVIVKELPFSHYGRSNKQKDDGIENEINILKLVHNHRNIVTFLDHIDSSESHYIVLEVCNLGDLREYLISKTELTTSDKLNIMHQTTSGLLHLHTRNPPIIHWDIQLENILMQQESNEVVVKLTDFGLSKECEEKATGFSISREPGMHYGSRTYAAPEYFDNHGKLDFTPSVDIFALGLLFSVLYKYSKHHTDHHPKPGMTFNI